MEKIKKYLINLLLAMILMLQSTVPAEPTELPMDNDNDEHMFI